MFDLIEAVNEIDKAFGSDGRLILYRTDWKSLMIEINVWYNNELYTCGVELSEYDEESNVSAEIIGLKFQGVIKNLKERLRNGNSDY